MELKSICRAVKKSCGYAPVPRNEEKGRRYERDFDSSKSKRVFWSNFRCLGLAKSPDIITPQIPIPQSATDDDRSFAFHTIDLVESE
jgi:hypothetical protein